MADEAVQVIVCKLNWTGSWEPDYSLHRGLLGLSQSKGAGFQESWAEVCNALALEVTELHFFCTSHLNQSPSFTQTQREET